MSEPNLMEAGESRLFGMHLLRMIEDADDGGFCAAANTLPKLKSLVLGRGVRRNLSLAELPRMLSRLVELRYVTLTHVKKERTRGPKSGKQFAEKYFITSTGRQALTEWEKAGRPTPQNGGANMNEPTDVNELPVPQYITKSLLRSMKAQVVDALVDLVHLSFEVPGYSPITKRTAAATVAGSLGYAGFTPPVLFGGVVSAAFKHATRPIETVVDHGIVYYVPKSLSATVETAVSALPIPPTTEVPSKKQDPIVVPAPVLEESGLSGELLTRINPITGEVRLEHPDGVVVVLRRVGGTNTLEIYTSPAMEWVVKLLPWVLS